MSAEVPPFGAAAFPDGAAFRDMLTARLGLRPDDRDLPHLEEVLRRRVAATGFVAPAPYLARLAAEPAWRAEIDELATELTIGETYFFRADEQIEAFFASVLPARLAAAGGAPIEVLSAGCASGEEPYSLAMGLRTRLPGLPRGAVALTGIDLNPDAIRRARRGHYRSWSLRSTPSAARARWFRAEGRHFELDDAIRAMVRFEPRNLAEPDPAFWRPGRFAAIFCRNVLIYFDREAARAVVARFAAALEPGGCLFLGAAESLRGLSEDFHLRHDHGAFYYERRGAEADAGSAAFAVAPLAPAPVAPPEVPDGGWVDAIHAAAARIERLPGGAKAGPGPGRPGAATGPLARPSAPPASPPPDARPPASSAAPASSPSATPAPAPADALAAIRAHLRGERFAEALDALAALPAATRDGVDGALLAGAALANMGRLAEAERAARAVLARDEFAPGAHYLLALCREQGGDREAAIAHDETAAYLDPTFAMPRLHLGLLAARAGDAATARRELGRAASLLADEDPARLDAFGGGFGREALQAVCRATLAGLEGGA